MKVLALEIASSRGSVAWFDSATDFDRHWPNDRKSSGAFFENLAEIRSQFGVPEKIIVGLGPGSYAGTRIAISSAIGLTAATGAELVGCPSICAMETTDNEYAVIGDARRESFFFARIRANELVEGPTLHAADGLGEQIAALGNQIPIFASEALPQFEGVRLTYPSARVLARLAQEANRSFVLPPLEPMYLREPHITTPRAV